MHRKLYTLIIVLLTSSLLAGSLHADTAGEAAGRIKQRLAQIDQMKASGEVGEDAKGYLAERQPLAGRKASIVTSENADRKIIYSSVSSRTGQSASQVGTQRALQIAERAHSGVWLQKSSGEWYKKP
jgi:uncharacterized protein YdbL (DUF1318 family)